MNSFVIMSKPTPYLDPLNQAAFEAIGNLPSDITIEELRKKIEEAQAHEELGGVTRESFVVTFEDGDITTWIYKPIGHGREALPVIFYIHGGGWISGT